MKRFLALISVALTVTLIAALSAMSFQPAAAVEEKSMDVSNDVIFISDSAETDGITGDGSSPTKPLDPTPASALDIAESTDAQGRTTGHYYLNTALYQAAAKLANTGGTIVVCGPVTIDASVSYGYSASAKDFIFPKSDKNLKITSVYDGVDYRTTNSASFMLENPSNIILNAPTIFESIKLDTNNTKDTVICANANRLVMGKDIETVLYKTETGSDNIATLVSIAGGSRHGRVDGDVDMTIESGVYYGASGSSWGAGSGNYVNVGNITMTFKGGKFRSGITCGVRNLNTHLIDGDVTVNIYPEAQFPGDWGITNKGGFASPGNEVTFNIYGGKFYDSAAKIYNGFGSVYNVTNYKASKLTLNLSNASSSTVSARTSGSSLNKLLHTFVTHVANNGIENVEIRYPSFWANSVTMLNAPTNKAVVENGEISSRGAKLKVSYTDPYDGTVYADKTVDYSNTDLSFKVEGSTEKAGTVNAKYKYGTQQYYSQNITVLNVPKINIIGAKIKASDKSYQGLKFVAYYTNESLPAGMTIEDYGIIGIPANLCPNSSALNFEDTYGMTIIDKAHVVDVKTIGNRVHFAGKMSEAIRPNNFNVDYHARAYLKLAYQGETYYIYSDLIRRNPYDIAMQIINDSDAQNTLETAATVENLASNVITKFDYYNVNTNYLDTSALRTKVVNAMSAQMNLTWTPSENFYIYNDSKTYGSGVKVDLFFEVGKTYRGIPYTNNNFSQKETFSDFLSPNPDDPSATKIFNIDKVEGLIQTDTKDQDIGHTNYLAFPGSDCSTAVITSWNTVINNRMELKNLTMTAYMLPGRGTGTIPVGDYECYGYRNSAGEIDTALLTCNRDNSFHYNNYYYISKNSNTALVTAGYNKLQPGDAIVRYRDSAGHARMVYSVDTAKKTVTTIECANWDIPTTPNSYDQYIVSWKKLTYSYDELLYDGYIPLTIPELVTGCSDSEYTYVTDLNLVEDLPAGKLTGKAISNRQIISVDIAITEKGTSNKTEIRYRPPTSTKYTEIHVPSVDLSQIDMSKFNLESGKTYTLDLNIRVAGLSDANPTVKLIKGYEFTKK